MSDFRCLKERKYYNNLSYKTTQKTYLVKYSEIIDGDTIRLASGQLVRFLSINTPEIKTQEKEAEAYAYQAKAYLKNLLRSSSFIKLSTNQKIDYYGRILANIFLINGESVEAQILQKGLAFYIPKDLPSTFKKYLKNQEIKAKNNRLGLWNKNPILTLPTKNIPFGFKIVHSKVKKITNSKYDHFMYLDGITLIIKKTPSSTLLIKKYKDRIIETRGWIVEYKKKHYKYKIKPINKAIIHLSKLDIISII